MNDFNFGKISATINVLPQKDGTTMYSVEAPDYYDQLEKLAFELSYAGKIIRYNAECSFFFVIGEDTNHYNLPKKLKRLSAREFKKLGWNVRFHKTGGKILLIAQNSIELKEITDLLKEEGFMYTVKNGISNSVYVEPNKKVV